METAVEMLYYVVRLAYNPILRIERVLVFPLDGALVPAILVPLALVAARACGFDPRSATNGILIVVPLLMIIYYLVWKYLVGFFNDMLGIG